MNLDQEVCGACRRPRDEREIQAGHDAVKERERLRRRRPRVLAARALAFCAAALLFHFRGAIRARASAWADGIMREIVAAQEPPAQARPRTAMGAAVVEMMRGPAAPAAVAARAAAPDGPPASAASAPAPRLSRPVPAEGPARRPAHAAKQPDSPAPGNLIVYGIVYDLKNGLAVPSAAVTLRDASNYSGFNSVTNEDGYYALELPFANRTGNYVITVKAPGFRTGQIEDPNPPYREQPEKSRLAALAELSDRDLEPVPVRFNSTLEFYPLDLVLAPASAPAP